MISGQPWFPSFGSTHHTADTRGILHEIHTSPLSGGQTKCQKAAAYVQLSVNAKRGCQIKPEDIAKYFETVGAQLEVLVLDLRNAPP